MDLGIKGRRAIVCASSKGLGRACAIALANEGVHVTITARGSEALAKTAADIRAANPDITVTVRPEDWESDRDVQLDAAIDYCIAQLGERPAATPPAMPPAAFGGPVEE